MAEVPSPTDFDDDADPLVGRVLGDGYVLQHRLGGGGFGAVYRARHEGSGEITAAKVLRVDRAALSSDARLRFRREAQALLSLRHPRIVSIHAHGTSDEGLEYLVMDLLEGEDLSEHLGRRRRMPLREALDVFDGMAEAVQFAHEQGIAHRDLKPANVFLRRTADGTHDPIVLDFGLAKMIEGSEESLTATGMVMGTPHYMAPEQATGEKIDYRADVYALGCILYEMIVGNPPFNGNTPTAILMQVLTSPPPQIPVDLGVPEPIEQAVRTALNKEPKARFQDVAAFRRALQRSASSVPLTRALNVPSDAPPATREARAVSSGLRHRAEGGSKRWVVPLATSVALLLAGGGVALVAMLGGENTAVTATAPTPVGLDPVDGEQEAVREGGLEGAPDRPTGPEEATRELGAPPTEMPEAPPEETPTVRSQPTQRRGERLTTTDRATMEPAETMEERRAVTGPSAEGNGGGDAITQAIARAQVDLEATEGLASAVAGTRRGLRTLKDGDRPSFCGRSGDLATSSEDAEIVRVVHDLRRIRGTACEPFDAAELTSSDIRRLRDFPEALDAADAVLARSGASTPPDQLAAASAAIAGVRQLTRGTADGSRPFPCNHAQFRTIRRLAASSRGAAQAAVERVERARARICNALNMLSPTEARELADRLDRELDQPEGNANALRDRLRLQLGDLRNRLR